MNGNSEANFPEADSTGAYASTPGGSTPGAGGHSAEANAGNDGREFNSGANPTDSYGAPGYVPPPPGYPPYGYGAPPPPPPPGSPNPGLAALLGFIPGVGAMYNGQFAKGIAHIVIFAVLTKLANHIDMFGLFVAGWVFYMVFDAYQTARARRDGLVMPDPFGLNNIGERFGMPGNPNWGDFVARPAPPADPNAPQTPPAAGAAAASTASAYAEPVYAQAPYSQPPYGAAASAAYPPPPVPPAAYPGAVPPPWQTDAPDWARQQAAADPGGTGYAPYQQTYTPAGMNPGAMPPMPPQPASGIPIGAIWLIGLGVIALVGSLAHNFYGRGYFFAAATCLLLGGVVLVQQTAVTRKLYQPGTAMYRWSLLHQARLGLILLLVGVLQMLAGLNISSWHYLWPYLLILIGLLQVADRSLYNRTLLETPAYPYGYAPVDPAAAPAATVPPANDKPEEVR